MRASVPVEITEGLAKNILEIGQMSFSYNINTDVMNWLYEHNIKGDLQWTRNSDLTNERVIFHFEKEEDAIAFKLRWL